MSELSTGEDAHPGRLTSIMRSVDANAVHALRVALVIDGRVVEEQTFAEPTRVTVGPLESDTFVVSPAVCSASLVLFEPNKTELVLCVTRHAAGRVATGARTLTSEEWRDHGLRLPVRPGLKGRLEWGRLSALFSYGPVAPRVAIAQASLPLERSLAIDWPTTVVAAASFLFHFGALASIYSDWADPPQDEGLTIQRLVESVRALPNAPEIEEKQDVALTETAATAVSTAEPSTKSAESPRAAPVSGQRPRGGEPRRMSDAEAGGLSAELAAMNPKMLAVLNAQGTSTDAVLDGNNLPASMFDRPREGAASRGPGQLDFGDSAGPVGTSDLAKLGNDGRGDPAPRPGVADPKLPKPDAPRRPDVPAPPTGPEEIPGLAKVIGGLQGGFRRCYQAGLDRESPDMAGGVRVTVKIGPNGDVMSTSAAPSGNLSSSVVACMVGKIRGAQFPKTPSGAPAVFVVPISMKRQ